MSLTAQLYGCICMEIHIVMCLIHCGQNNYPWFGYGKAKTNGQNRMKPSSKKKTRYIVAGKMMKGKDNGQIFVLFCFVLLR